METDTWKSPESLEKTALTIDSLNLSNELLRVLHPAMFTPGRILTSSQKATLDKTRAKIFNAIREHRTGHGNA